MVGAFRYLGGLAARLAAPAAHDRASGPREQPAHGERAFAAVSRSMRPARPARRIAAHAAAAHATVGAFTRPRARAPAA
ncbi:hypothetical protein PTBPS01_12460 [Burkholderia pseudomallei]|nr:hypothetical protein PTBPS01_12460 [Burkholderia pseudomallei]